MLLNILLMLACSNKAPSIEQSKSVQSAEDQQDALEEAEDLAQEREDERLEEEEERKEEEEEKKKRGILLLEVVLICAFVDSLPNPLISRTETKYIPVSYLHARSPTPPPPLFFPLHTSLFYFFDCPNMPCLCSRTSRPTRSNRPRNLPTS